MKSDLPKLILCIILCPVVLIGTAIFAVEMSEQKDKQAFAVLGDTVKIIRCDKNSSKYSNSYYWVTAEKPGDTTGLRRTVCVNSNRASIPLPGETWTVDTTGWRVVFKAKIADAK